MLLQFSSKMIMIACDYDSNYKQLHYKFYSNIQYIFLKFYMYTHA